MQLIDSMVAKGWIAKQRDGRTYCRTAKGEQVMKIILKIW
jgi:predicted transcriptional regulator